MRTCNLYAVCCMLILAALLTVPIGYAYAWSNSDNADRLSNDQAGVFSPGYLNAAKQQAYSIVNQNNQPKSWWNNLVDRIKNKISDKVEEHANTKVQPEVKKKTGAKSYGNATPVTLVVNTADLGSAGYLIIDAVNNGTGEITLQNGNKIVAHKDDEGYHASVVDGNNNVIVDPLLFTASGDTPALGNTIKTFEVTGGYLSVGMAANPDITDWEACDHSYEVYVTKLAEYTAEYTSLYWNAYYWPAYNDVYDPNMPMLDYYAYEYMSSGFDEATANSMAMSYVENLADQAGREAAQNYINDRAITDAAQASQEAFDDYINSHISSTVTSGIEQSIVYTANSSELLTNIVDTHLLNSEYNGTYNAEMDTFDTNSLKTPLAQDAQALGVGDMMGMNNTTPLGKAFSQAILNQATLNFESMRLRLAPEGDASIMLSKIISDPTADQKAILEAAESLIADIAKIAEAIGNINPELTQAENDLLQMVAAALLAQGVPDLLKAGDIEGVKGIFKDLGQSKDKIMLDYNTSIKPYYTNIVKDLSTNLAMLQLKGILSKKITEEELKNLEPREVDRIIENIRKSNDKSFELSYILQQDAKYRKEYMDPQNKALEEAMKAMMNSFTQRLNKVLEDKK